MVFARLVYNWTNDEMTKQADVIVIAAPVVATHDTAERTFFPNVLQGSSRIPAVGVETTFKVLKVLKGDMKMETFVFHHLRCSKPEDSLGLGVVAFDPKKKKGFLLYLKRESGSRYSSVTGQTDANIGVRELGENQMKLEGILSLPFWDENKGYFIQGF